MNKIKVFLRHYNKANLRKQNVRPTWFSYEKCYQSLKNADIDLTILLDGNKSNHHFNFDDTDNVIEYYGGSDAASFKFCLDTMMNSNLQDNDIVYIVEDDYMHHPNWAYVMKDAFDSFNVDYVTLYDHPDKYFLPMYDQLQSKILHTKTTHWRTTPSTCNTYAAKWQTFKKHWDIHMKYCSPEHTHDGYDHTKFLDLWNHGSNLISSIPGYSTHCEIPFLSPLTDWANI